MRLCLAVVCADPTLKNQVGNDRGPQYRHGIYYHTEEQKAKAEAVLAEVQTKYNKPIVTELKPAAVFWPAEEVRHTGLTGREGLWLIRGSADVCVSLCGLLERSTTNNTCPREVASTPRSLQPRTATTPSGEGAAW